MSRQICAKEQPGLDAVFMNSSSSQDEEVVIHYRRNLSNGWLSILWEGLSQRNLIEVMSLITLLVSVVLTCAPSLTAS